MQISRIELGYLIVWVTALLWSAGMMFARPARFEICSRAYWTHLLQPWKIFTFAVALALITVVAPYSGDPTWDYPDAIIISVLTFVVAPWSIGVFFLACRHRQFDSRLLVAVCMFFTPCWFYDLYIFLRDHGYPATWLSNVFLSGPIVALAGLFWNLAWLPEAGMHFSFSKEPWLTQRRTPFHKVFVPALLIAVPVVALVFWFVMNA